MTSFLPTVLALLLTAAPQSGVSPSPSCPGGIVTGSGYDGQLYFQERDIVQDHLNAGGTLRVIIGNFWFTPISTFRRNDIIYAESPKLMWDPHDNPVLSEKMGAGGVGRPISFLVGTDGSMKFTTGEDVGSSKERVRWCLA